MITRRPVAPYGPPAVTPDGTLWAKYPDDLWGDLGKALQFALRALLFAWNGLTVTELTRAELRDRINELRAQKGKKPITNLGTISWYFAELKKLGVIERGRVEEKKNDWFTRFTKPFQAKMDDSPTLHVGKEGAAPLKISELQNATAIDLETGKWAVEFCEKKGWRVLVSDKPDLSAIDGMDQEELPRDFKVAVAKHWVSIQAFLNGAHQRE